MATAMTHAAQADPEPGVEVWASTSSPRVGEPFELAVDLVWTDSEAGGALLPPGIVLPDGVEAGELRAATAAGTPLGMSYRLELVALQAGPFTLGPVEVRYRGAGAEEVTVLSVAGPDVEVLPRSRVWLVVVTVLTAGGLGWLGLMRMRRASDEAPPVRATPGELLEGARRCRSAGDVEGCLEALVAAARLVDGLPGPVAERLHALVERARFGGESPSRSELAGLVREIEVRLGEMDVIGGHNDGAGE